VVSIPAGLLETVRRCLLPLEGAARGLVVAVSGGPDSVALLRLLIAAREPGWPLVLAHLNHQLRGPESDADEAFVADLHAGLTTAGVPGLTLRCHRLDVAAAARAAGENLEAAARQLRYRWLAEVARGEGMRWVATGHTADDQAETVLHRLLRGTGLQGLRGISPQRPLEAGVGVVRPLLQARRADLLDCLARLGQPYRQDSSNASPEFLRNRIRLELLPHLEEHYNPQVAAVLARLAAQVDEVYRLEEEAARALLYDAERPRAGAIVVLDQGRLAAAPRQQVREVFRLVWAREGWPLDPMTFAAWERLADLVFGGATAVDLPGRIHARRKERVVQLQEQL
jgi:tRNA(Ile)-lysidine synthase